LPGTFEGVAAKAGLDIAASAVQINSKDAQRKPTRAKTWYLNKADSPLYDRPEA
jgi:hypothetical protein